jgi:hypothetical protein
MVVSGCPDFSRRVPGIDGAIEAAGDASAYGGLLDGPVDLISKIPVFVPRFAADYRRFGLAAS